MTRLLSSLVGLSALMTSLALATTPADDKKDEQPIKGTWVKEGEGHELSFNFKTKDELILKVKAGGNGMTVTCKYTVEKGVVSAEVTEVKEEGEFPAKPPKGYKMKFAFKVEKDAAKLSDFDAENKDEVKGIVEGDYKPKKAD